MGQVSFYRLKSTPHEKKRQGHPQSDALKRRYLFADEIIELAFDRSVNIRPSNGFKWFVFECINT